MFCAAQALWNPRRTFCAELNGPREPRVKEDPPPLLGQIRALRSENARLRDEIRWLKMIDDPMVLDMPAE